MKYPGKWTVEQLFVGRSKPLALFMHIQKFIISLGAVTMEPMKTQISFGAKRKFAWVWLPQLWTSMRPENSVTLTFDLSKQVKDKKIAEAVKTRPGHWTHHVIIERKSDLDQDVKGWIRKAYLLSRE